MTIKQKPVLLLLIHMLKMSKKVLKTSYENATLCDINGGNDEMK